MLSPCSSWTSINLSENINVDYLSPIFVCVNDLKYISLFDIKQAMVDAILQLLSSLSNLYVCLNYDINIENFLNFKICLNPNYTKCETKSIIQTTISNLNQYITEIIPQAKTKKC